LAEIWARSHGRRQRRRSRGFRETGRGVDLPQDARSALEAIIDEDLRPAIDIVDGDFTSEHPLWTELTTNAAMHGRLRTCIPSIGRIELPDQSLPYGGTGVVVGTNLVMTNRHVAEIFAAGVGTRHLAFKPNCRAGVDFRREQDRPAGPMIDVVDILLIHPY
jgi:endonuclease G